MKLTCHPEDVYKLTFKITITGATACVEATAPEFHYRLSRRPVTWTSDDAARFLKREGLIVTEILKRDTLKNGGSACWKMNLDASSPALPAKKKTTRAKTRRPRVKKQTSARTKVIKPAAINSEIKSENDLVVPPVQDLSIEEVE